MFERLLLPGHPSVNICCWISYLTIHRTTCSHSHVQKESVVCSNPCFSNVYTIRYSDNCPLVLPCEQSLLFWNKNHTDDITSWSRFSPLSLSLFILNNWKSTKHIRSHGGYANSIRLSKLNWDENKFKSNTRGRIYIKIIKVEGAFSVTFPAHQIMSQRSTFLTIPTFELISYSLGTKKSTYKVKQRQDRSRIRTMYQNNTEESQF